MIALVSLAFLAAQPAPGPGAITLDDALAEAARANADILLARTNSESASVDAYASYAGVLPRLDLSAAFGHTFIGAQQTPIGFGLPPVQAPATDQGAYSVGLTLQLPIFDGGRNWNGIRRAQTGARAAERSLDETRLGVAFEVVRRFYEVVKAQESLRVLDETVARSDGIVRRAEALFEAGRGSRADLLSAVGNLGNDRIAVEQQRARVAQARADLAVLLGRDAGAPLEVAPPEAVMGPALPSAAPPPPDAELLERARRAIRLHEAHGR
jgi:outer membrane protein TolC